MSSDQSARFYELKTFIDHLKICSECQRKLSLDDIYGEIMVHAEGNEMQKQNKKLKEV